MKKVIGVFLILHGLAHTLDGMRAADYATGGRALIWFNTVLWGLAMMGFIAAGLGTLGIKGFPSPTANRKSRRRWLIVASVATTASLLLLGLFRPPLALVGGGIDLVIAVLLWQTHRRAGFFSAHLKPPAYKATEHENAIRPAHRWAPRIGHAVAVFFVAYLALLVLLRPWHMRWGAADAELRAPLPGDAFAPNPPTYQVQHAVTIHAPAEAVWPWLAQLGQDRGGFYSYAWLENLFGLGIRNADRIHPEWQGLADGDTVFATPPGWLGLDQRLGWEVTMAEPGRVLVLKNWGAFILQPIDAHTTRFIIRTRGGGAPAWWDVPMAPFGLLVFEPAHFIMERKMMRGIKARAEAARASRH